MFGTINVSEINVAAVKGVAFDGCSVICVVMSDNSLVTNKLHRLAKCQTRVSCGSIRFYKVDQHGVAVLQDEVKIEPCGKYFPRVSSAIADFATDFRYMQVKRMA